MNYENEVWRPIGGYPKYEVSNYGRVASLDYMHTGKRQIMAIVNVVNGYKAVKLYNDKGFKLCRIHRLVAKAFLPNHDNLPLVNHKDENPANNCVDNLEWCTHQYNSTYNDAHIKRGLRIRGERNGMYGKHHTEKSKQLIRDKLSGVPTSPETKQRMREGWGRNTHIFQYDMNWNFIGEYYSTIEAMEKTCVNDRSIRACCQGKQKTAGGYRWERVKIDPKTD